VIATLRVSGLSSSDRAIVGSAVAMTVESRFCMNIAQATTSGTRIGRGAASAAVARLFQRSDDNGNLLGVIYLLFREQA
jgi:hypothetical protein